MKTFSAYKVLGTILMTSYSSQDIQSIQSFSDTFSNYESKDKARLLLEKRINTLLKEFTKCNNEDQLSSILKKQPIDIKYFIFEKIQVSINALSNLKIHDFQINDSISTGQALAQFLQKTWESLVLGAEKNNNSVSDICQRILLDNC